MTRHDQPDPDFQQMADMLADATVERFYAAQAKRNRKAVAKHLDGEFSLNRLLHAMRNDRVHRDAPYELWSVNMKPNALAANRILGITLSPSNEWADAISLWPLRVAAAFWSAPILIPAQLSCTISINSSPSSG
jgi:hypothetical protein